MHTAEERQDRISQLPDDLISSIISRLRTRDAVRTSILSRRWRRVYTLIDDVRFMCSDTFGGGAACYPIFGEERLSQLQRKFAEGVDTFFQHGEERLSQLQRKFAEGVDTFFQHHSGSKIKSFKLVCCFRGRILDSFRKWMNSVGKLGVEKLTLEFCCLNNLLRSGPPVFSTDFLTEASSVKHLWLHCGYFQTPSKNALEILELDHIAFTSEAVECMLSNCSSLKSLNLGYCALPSKLQIHGRDLQLKSLMIYQCKNVEEIDLSAINLIKFEIFNPTILKLSFSHVPLLQTLVIDLYCIGVTHLFEKLAKDLPHLESMVFATYACFFEGWKLDRVISKLSNLRQLVLILDYYHKLDLLELVAFLDACPLLHKFQLSMVIPGTFDLEKAWERMVRRDTQLKEVEFNGFTETETEYHFILYILKTVASLRRLLISRSTLYYQVCPRRWMHSAPDPRNKMRHRIIREQLQGQAISKNVEIITF